VVFGLFGLVGSLLAQRQSLLLTSSILFQERRALDQIGFLCCVPIMSELPRLFAPGSSCAAHAVRVDQRGVLRYPFSACIDAVVELADVVRGTRFLGYGTLSGQNVVLDLDLAKLSVLASYE
jgi:hypothetical protein